MSLWHSNNSNALWHGTANGSNSTKFTEFVNTLWKTYGKDYQIPDNLAAYAEEYFEDYKLALNGEENSYVRYPVQCHPQPGKFQPQAQPLPSIFFQNPLCLSSCSMHN